jgi:hypothetical protein
MDYILLAIISYAIIFNCMAITMVRTLKTQHGAIKGQIATVTIAENKIKQSEDVMTSNRYCEICGESYFTHNGDGSCIDDREADISATIADIENHLLSDYERYRDTILELKALPCPVIEHTDGDTDNNAIENLKERKPIDYEMPTSGLEAGQPYKVDNTLTWEENIKLWEEREPIPYPEGYYQGVVLFEDDKPIFKSTDGHDKSNFKKLIKKWQIEKIKKPRKSKSKIGVC